MAKKFTVIDLFCGCGGFSLGFKSAGFDVLLGIDNWADAIKTYSANFPETQVITGDIRKTNGAEILKKLGIGKNDVDVIIGGPPCQGFSLSGKRLYDDPRNTLYKSFVEIVRDIRPKMFVMENVPGLIRLFDGKVEKAVIQDFSDLGYEVRDQILYAEKYGVPQDRRRVFFVGVNKEKIKNTAYFVFPKPTNGPGLKPFVTCKEAISDLDFVPVDHSLGEVMEYRLPATNDYQKMMREGSLVLNNHSITVHTPRTREIIAMVPDGGNYLDLPVELQQTRKVHIAWTRMNSAKPCFTIDCGHNHQFHYKENRVPTVRESARIQSFPDTFVFVGIRTKQYKEVGNAVPVLLGKAVAEEIKKVLKKG